jgi:RNA polymerase sigma factor (sigma-70 family)
MFNPRYHTAIEEMMVEAAAWVYKDLWAFDPSMTFNTFAGYRIKRAGHMYVAEVINNRTEKYEQFSIKINKTISELKQKGVDFDLQTISTVSGIPLVTIEEVLAQNSANATSISLNDPSITAGKANQDGVTALDEYLSADDLASYYKKDTPSPEEISVEKEEAKKIRAALSKLDKTTREIVKLKNGFYNSAIGDGEIAERLGISQNEVRQRYSSGRRELRRILEKDVTFSDRAIVGRAKKLDKTIKFMPSVSDTDIEDAAHFMTLDIVV